jgi:hypothetical protein
VGTVTFQLDPADNGPAQPPGEPEGAEATAATGNQAGNGAGAAIPAPPRLPYTPDPGSYTQIWLSQSAVTSAEELRQEMDTYVNLYTDVNPDYTAIQVLILNSAEWTWVS